MVKDKLDFISKYKFNIAFENSSVLGYTTEKLMEPFIVDTVPIYWGNPEAYKDFNEKAFINVNVFSSLEEAAEFVVKVDSDDDAYLN
ncbi:MAG: glycosyltransferase family 10 [Bacteroides sp.]|nr:glycosyltransferase family 10 [Bacteroides sp.]